MRTLAAFRVFFSAFILTIGAATTWPAPPQDSRSDGTDSSTLKADTTNQDLSPVGEAVVRLLEGQDAKKFAEEITPALQDWRSVQSTNIVQKERDPLGPLFERGLAVRRKEMAANAERVSEKARSLGLSQVRFRVKGVTAKTISTYHHPQIQAEGESLPWAYGIDVVLTGEPLTPSKGSERFRGEYQVQLASGTKFRTGWRCDEGIRWKSFPKGVADDKTAWELAFLNKWSVVNCNLTLADDPALGELGDVLVRFLRERDENIFVSKALMNFDENWGELVKKLTAAGQKIPDRKEVEASWAPRRSEIAGSARVVLAQAERIGLTSAEIRLKDVVAENAYRRDGIGSIENITCNELRFTLSVHSDHLTQSGRPISGDYILSGSRGRRGDGRWTISTPIRWQSFPEGVLDAKEAEDSAFENYVAEHGVLPTGTAAPNVQLTGLNDEAKVRLADFRGKIVFLEFWATWCGPCQEPLSKLQTLRRTHPDWKDRVAVITLSIDDELKQARDHLQQRGWTNTISVWAGPGGWRSEPAKSFRVSGVPTAYLLNREGKVAWAGHPMDIVDIGKALDGMLRSQSN